MGEASYFDVLSSIDLRSREQDKNGLRVVPWAVAYSEIMKYDPKATYEFLRDRREVVDTYTSVNDDGVEVQTTVSYTQELPYFDTGIGYEVRCRMTVDGVTKEMNLPVYNSQNKSMGSTPRTYTTKKGGEVTVDKAFLDDVYKSQMRCLAKVCAAFGVALNLWTKEDAPESVMELEKAKEEAWNLFVQKGGLSTNTKLRVNEIAKETLPEECNGDLRLCDDADVLKGLIKKFKAVRMIPDEADEKATKPTKTKTNK